MSQISEVNENILTKILKTDSFYEALWGKEDFTPETTISTPDDYNCGAIANQLEYIYDFIREITGRELDDLPEPYIDIVVYFFTGLKRFTDEVNTDLIRRMKSLLIREGDWRSERFGTPWDIKNVFSYYLDCTLLYYIPNAVLTDLLINGDFENTIAGEWVFSPSGDRSTGESFDGEYKLDFTDFTDVSQTLAVTSGSYILNCFVKPIAGPPEGFGATWDAADVNFENAAYTDQDFMFESGGSPLPDTEIDTFNLIVQRDSDSKYFNTTTEVWDVAIPSNIFTSIGGEWQLAEFYIIVDGTYNITIQFSKAVDFYLDRVEFGEKLYPAYEMLYIDSGLAIGFASAWDAGVEYDKASYLDQDFMFSSATSSYSDTWYQSLLDMVKASGIKGIFTREVKT